MRRAAAVVLALALAACSAGEATGAREGAGGDAPAGQGPEREGEAVTALDGDTAAYSYELVAQRSSDGLCLELRDDEDGESVGCGFEVPERHDVGFFVHQGPGDDPTQDLVVGQVSAEADAVLLEYAEGESDRVEVTAVAALEAAVFAAPLDPERELAAVVVLAGDEELERRSATGS